MRYCSVVSAPTTDAVMTLVLVSQVLQGLAHYGLSAFEAYFGFRMGDPYSVFKVGSAETAAVSILSIGSLSEPAEIFYRVVKPVQICDLVVLTDVNWHAQEHRPNPEVFRTS